MRRHLLPLKPEDCPAPLAAAFAFVIGRLSVTGYDRLPGWTSKETGEVALAVVNIFAALTSPSGSARVIAP